MTELADRFTVHLARFRAFTRILAEAVERMKYAPPPFWTSVPSARRLVTLWTPPAPERPQVRHAVTV
jgi:hypothetical protein